MKYHTYHKYLKIRSNGKTKIKRQVDYPLWCRYTRHDRAICNQVMQEIVKPIQIGIYIIIYTYVILVSYYEQINILHISLICIGILNFIIRNISNNSIKINTDYQIS